jgi:hypothetical protein
MDSIKETNNKTNEFNDYLNSAQDNHDDVPTDVNDIPVTKEETETINELLGVEEEPNDELKVLKEEYLECRKFYSKLRGLNQYDLTENNFKYWKGEPYVGTGYRNFIKKSSKIMVLTALINERIQINVFDKLIKQKKDNTNNVPIEDGILKYVRFDHRSSFQIDSIFYSKKSIKFLEWRLKSHLFRFGFIKKYLETEYHLNYSDFKTYKDVENYFNLPM